MRSAIVFALVIGILAFLALPAFAQTSGAVPSVDPLVWSALVLLGAVPVGLVVRGLREVFPESLAPSPSTTRSKRFVLGAAVVCGVLLALAGFPVALWPALAGKVVGGAACGFAAYFGAGAMKPEARLDHLGRVGAQDES